MEHITYNTRGVCSRRINIDIEDGRVVKVVFEGGCSGNTQGVAALVAGMEIDEAIRRLSGIRCNFKPTSCPDQLARALEKALEEKSLEVIPSLEIGRTDIIMQMLEAGAGISFLPDFVTREMIEEGRLCYLDVCDMGIEIWKQLIYHKNKWMSKSMKTFIEYIKANEFSK